MRGFGLVAALILLAGCDTAPTEGGNPGLFEPFMYNDVAYDATIIRWTPIEDAALLAQGFVTSREIRITRMTELPFGPDDAAEAEAVAAAFCVGGNVIFVPGAQGILDDRAGYVFAHSCLEREG